jgi:hypothetical protein
MDEVHEPLIRSQDSGEEVPSRSVVSHPQKKVFTYQELPGSLEYPHTLDLRRKWSPNVQ